MLCTIERRSSQSEVKYFCHGNCTRDYSAEDYSAGDYSEEDYSAEDYSAEDYSAEDNSAEDYSAVDFSTEDYSTLHHTVRETIRGCIPQIYSTQWDNKEVKNLIKLSLQYR